MTKKIKAIETAFPDVEAADVAVAATDASERSDPTLLGVSVPLSITITATKQVMNAWGQCFQALSLAVRAKLAKPAQVLDATAEPEVIQA